MQFQSINDATLFLSQNANQAIMVKWDYGNKENTAFLFTNNDSTLMYINKDNPSQQPADNCLDWWHNHFNEISLTLINKSDITV